MTFKLTIRLGNDAMQTREDVAEALVRVAEKLRAGLETTTIRDLNGNTVGEWSYKGGAA